jgi:hypothetical protein
MDDDLDLFEPDVDPKSRAISFALRRVVECWINDDIEEADRMFRVAEDFVRAPVTLFNP